MKYILIGLEGVYDGAVEKEDGVHEVKRRMIPYLWWLDGREIGGCRHGDFSFYFCNC